MSSNELIFQQDITAVISERHGAAAKDVKPENHYISTIRLRVETPFINIMMTETDSNIKRPGFADVLCLTRGGLLGHSHA